MTVCNDATKPRPSVLFGGGGAAQAIAAESALAGATSITVVNRATPATLRS
jgi:shikimate 5-dehydrogenase